ncbi:lymphocyte antigen 6K [Pteronotus mesoamericanus]|uniref:lymphocyte antigen 6K n=1 Tax=Pteronotus mesoamericanus TaxID=1884717 RepID=UPI0023ED922D|nr:lymphocyte antigen 6K [Pteronotus parnellii mesoamericanus]
MTVLLVLLLVTGLPRVETNVTVAGRQTAARCYVCEKENDFSCNTAKNCPDSTYYCSTAAVKLFRRFVFVSKQCAKYCPVYEPSSAGSRHFVLEKPLPFVYVSCCRGSLCNTEAPNVTDYREAGRARPVWRGSAGLALFLTLGSACLGLRLA